MGADASIFGQYLKSPKSVQEYTDEANASQISQQNLQKNALELQASQQSMQRSNALRDLVTNMPTDPASRVKALRAANTPEAWAAADALEKSQAEIGFKQAEAGKHLAETDSKKLERSIKAHDFALQQLQTANDPVDAHAWAAEQFRNGTFTREQYAQGVANIPNDPDKFATWKEQALRGGASVLDNLKIQHEDLRNAATNATSRANNTATVGATIRGQNMVDARKKEELAGAEAAFTPEAIKNAAARYNIDGTLPPMGMGKAGSAGRAAILNEAANQATGVNPDQQRIEQIGNKANTAALSKLQQQQTMVGSFEHNFVKNADIALEYSAKVDRTGVPLANKWINAGKRSIAGDPDLAAFDQAIKSASNEYAKIISGSMGNTAVAEGEIRKMEEKLNSAQTPAQVKAVIDLMKRETQNRMTAFDEEKASLRSSMGRKNAGPAQPAKTQGGASVSAW